MSAMRHSYLPQYRKGGSQMKLCPKCAEMNENAAEFCKNCGESLAEVPATQEDIFAIAGGFLGKAKEAASARTKAIEQPVEFVDQDESMTAVIGTNYLQNFLSGGNVEKAVGVLTQKRFYFKGRSFVGSGKDLESTTQEGVVSIEDISYTNFIHSNPTGFLISAIVFTIGIVTIPIALYFYVKYFISRQTLFVVSFPGGSFGFDIRYYPIADIRDFQRQLHLMKDHIKENA